MSPNCRIHSRTTTRSALLVILAAWAVAAALPVAAQEQATPAARIAALQRAGRITEALALCRQENAARPGQALMLYNQACLESRAGQVPEAVRSLQAAFDAGFDDDTYALADPDLQGAAAESVRQVVDTYRQRRAALSVRRGARLAEGRPVVLALEAAKGDPDPQARLTVTWEPVGLALRLEADDSGGLYMPAEGARPWTGESGLVVMLGNLAETGSGTTDDSYVFAFGLEKNAGVGAVLVTGTHRWQRVRELQPKIRGGGTGHLLVDVTIPWTAIAPYHPLTDPALGLNANLLRRDRKAGPRLMPSTVLEHADSAQQPAAQLAFDLSTATAGIMRGRVPTTIVSAGALAINLVTVSDRAGRGRLTIDFQDSEGHSLLKDGAESEDVDLDSGLNTLNRAVDFSRLRTGPCRISTEVVTAAGTKAEWSTWLLNLGPEWEPRYRSAIAELPADERPTAEYYLAAVAAGVQAHRARRDPGALTTTLGDLNLMLSRFKQTGSLVAAEGLTPFVYPGPGGADRLCQLVLPAGRPDGLPLVPVLVVGGPAADGPRLAERIVRRFVEARPDSAQGPPRWWPVFVVAAGITGSAEGTPKDGAASGSDAVAELRSCARWARERFAANRLLLAAQQEAVMPALDLARAADAKIGDLLIFADGMLTPLPGAGEAELARRVGAPPAGVEVGWIDFAQETTQSGQARKLAVALAKAGWPVKIETVRGSPSFTQVADRTCLWQSRLASRH